MPLKLLSVHSTVKIPRALLTCIVVQRTASEQSEDGREQSDAAARELEQNAARQAAQMQGHLVSSLPNDCVKRLVLQRKLTRIKLKQRGVSTLSTRNKE